MTTGGVLCGQRSKMGGCFLCLAQSAFGGQAVESSPLSCSLQDGPDMVLVLSRNLSVCYS